MALLETWRSSFARVQNEDWVRWYFIVTFATFPFANNAQHRLLYYLAIPFLLIFLSRHLARPLAREPLLRDPLLLVAFAFLAWALLSLAWSENWTAESLSAG